MNETHLSDGTIIETDTGEVIMSAHEAAMETNDFRVNAAREFLATKPPLAADELAAENAEARRLLGLVVEVCDDWAVTDPDSPDYVPIP